MSKTWETDIESDVGTLRLKIEYFIDYGQKGDYDSPSIEPGVEIEEMELSIKKLDPDVVQHLREEILEEVVYYDPEDDRD